MEPAWNCQKDLSGVIEQLSRQHGESKVACQLAALERHGKAVDDPDLWLRTALSRGFKFTAIERVGQCPCGCRLSRLLCRFVFWNLLGVRQCQDCGLIYVSPRLTQEAVTRVFNEYYFDYSRPEYWGSRRFPIFRDVLNLLARYKCKSVFDVGTAFGYFVAEATRAGLQAAGCDLSGRAVEWGRAKLGVNLLHGRIGELDLAESSFDSVVSLDTFYYVSDPMAELRAMRRMVKAGGYVILRLRNGLQTLGRARREANKSVGDEVMPSQHLWAFTPKTIQRLLELCEFEVVACEAASYSRSRWAALQALSRDVNRLLLSGFPKWGIRTKSFNIVARR